jgi:hypothetical protein
MIFQFARWPWALAGTIAALRDWLTGSAVDFRITPKGNSAVDPLPVRVLAPYAGLSIVSALPVVLVNNPGEASGFYVLALLNTAIYTMLLAVIVIQHARENTLQVRSLSYRAALSLSFVAMFTLMGIGGARNGMTGVESLAWGAGRISLFSETYSITGAGLGNADIRKVRFHPQWLPSNSGS